MFHINQGNTQVYSIFGSYVVEQHQAPYQRPANEPPRADLPKDQPHSEREDRLAA